MGIDSNIKFSKYESASKVMWQLAFRDRFKQFNAVIDTVPTAAEFSHLAETCANTDIQSIIMSCDGMLTSAYAEVADDIRGKLEDIMQSGINVVVFPDAPYTRRFERLRSAGVIIPRSRKTDASLQTFTDVCKECSINPSSTAVMGSSPITDFPNLSENDTSSFPLKVLVDPIKPIRWLMEPIEGFGANGLKEPVEGFFARKLVQAKYKYNAFLMAVKERARYARALRDYDKALRTVDVVRTRLSDRY